MEHITIPYHVNINFHMIENGVREIGSRDNLHALIAIKDLSGLAVGEKIKEARAKIRDLLSRLDPEHRRIILERVVDYAIQEEILREDKWGKEANIIILTNLSDGDSLSTALKNGAYDFLVKADWRLEDVVSKVKEKLGI